MLLGGGDRSSVNNNHSCTINLNNNEGQILTRENDKNKEIKESIKEILGWLNIVSEYKMTNKYHQKNSIHRESRNNIINHARGVDADCGQNNNKKGGQLQLGYTANRCKNFKEKLGKGGSDQVSVKIRILNVQGFSDIKYIELKDRFLGGDKEYNIICLTETHQKTEKVKIGEGLFNHLMMREFNDKKGGGLQIIGIQNEQVNLEKM